MPRKIPNAARNLETKIVNSIVSTRPQEACFVFTGGTLEYSEFHSRKKSPCVGIV